MYLRWLAGLAKFSSAPLARSGTLLALKTMFAQTSTWPNSPAGPFG